MDDEAFMVGGGSEVWVLFPGSILSMAWNIFVSGGTMLAVGSLRASDAFLSLGRDTQDWRKEKLLCLYKKIYSLPAEGSRVKQEEVTLKCPKSKGIGRKCIIIAEQTRR